MRVISWNLACWKPGHFASNANRQRIWGEIAAMGADLYLLQEAVVADFETLTPEWFTHEYRLITSATRNGSAIVARAELQPEAVPTQNLSAPLEVRSGRNRVAEITMADGTRTVVASVHPSAKVVSEDDEGFNEQWRRTSASEAWENDAIFWELATQFTGAHRPFLIGGDWNTARLFDINYPDDAPAGQDWFDRAAANSWCELHRRMHRYEQETYIEPTAGPYQLDHLFSDPALAARLTRCDVLDGDVLREISDHLPLIAEFDYGDIAISSTRPAST